MNKIFRLAFANIKKSMGHTISLLSMFLIAALLLNAGLLVLINFGSFFNDTVEELNTSNIYYILSDQLYTDEVDNIFQNDNVIELQKEDSIWLYAKINYKDELTERALLLNDASYNRNLSKWKFVGEHLPEEEMSIYLPSIFYKDGGYKLNDKFTIAFNNKTFEFTVKGFTEDVYFTSLETGLLGIYLPHDTYVKVSSQIDDIYNAKLIYANLQKVNKDIETSIRDLTNAEMPFTTTELTHTLFSFDISIIKLSRVMMSSMISVMIVCFSLIIVGVCLIVIRFRIGNSIEDDMTKIGALKALGYTSKQIILSVVMQFLLIAFVGALLGIAISYLITPALSNVFAQQSGLIWVQGFDSVISSISLFVIIIIVYLVAVLTSRSINKLHPIIALRGGLTTHSFRKNHFPLSKTKGGLSLNLAFKSMIQNFKQSIMIIIILIVVSFAGTFSVVMYYNTNVDTTTFYETPGTELSNAIAILNPDRDNTDLITSIRNIKGVRKVQFIDNVMVKVDNTEVLSYVMDDFSSKETITIYQGRYPLHNNEIAISGLLSEMLDKTIGDVITLKLDSNEDTFLITGLTQGSNMGGLNVSLKLESILKLNPNYKQQALQIYLNNDVVTSEFVAYLESTFKGTILSVVDMDKSMDLGVGVYTAIVSQVGIVILLITIIVDFLVLYFMINSSIIRKKRELGIQKAIGFTTFQLMNQVSLGFVFPIIIGVILGCILGILYTNNIMSIVQKSMGIMKSTFIVTPSWIALFGLLTVIISYLSSMLLTSRIRKISAYILVTE